MKFYQIFFGTLILLLQLFSCNTQQNGKVKSNSMHQDSLVSIEVHTIADLPDSLKPKVSLLNSKPKPQTLAVPIQFRGFYTEGNSKDEKIKMSEGGRPNFTYFNTDNGLPLDAILCSIQDKNGNIWIGTAGGGLSVYDGKSFTNFTTVQGLADNAVMSILKDKGGNLWLGTGNGVSLYDGKSFANFSTAQGLADNAVMSILEDKDGNIWLGTGNGVSRYDGKSFTNFSTAQGLTNNVVRCIWEDKKGNIWFGTNSGVSCYNGKTFNNFSTAQEMINTTIRCILEDKRGNLWFGTQGGTVIRYDGKSFYNFTKEKGLSNSTVFSILEDKSGNIWLGTDGGGVIRYDGNSFTNFTTALGLSNNIVRSILEDKNENLWFGTFGGGLTRYNGKSFTNFTTSQGLTNNAIFSILEDKNGNHWFGTANGVNHYNGKSFTNLTSSQGLANNIALSILEDKNGKLWFGTNGGGLSRYDGKSFTNYTTSQGLANNVVSSILEDKRGNLWLGTGSGLSRYDGKSFTNYTSAQGLAENAVTSILEDKSGVFWFGTFGGGISRYDGRSFINFTKNQGIANNNINIILEDSSGNLWFGTDEGLSLLPSTELSKLDETVNKSKGELKLPKTIFKNFTIKDGLPNNFVTQLIQLPNHKIVVGTNLGITLFNFDNKKNQLVNIEIYNTNTGYPVKDVNTGQSMYLDNKGIIWAATGSDKTALVCFDYDALFKNTDPPVVKIQSVKIDGEGINWYKLNTKGKMRSREDTATDLLQDYIAYGKALSQSENKSILKHFGKIKFDSITKFNPIPLNLVLPYDHNHISFEFLAIETYRPQLVKYQYILEGYDKNWNPITNQTNATFGNINEGTYTFKLKAQGPNGIWSEPITYTFKVLPPWYRSWWAFISYMFLAIIASRMFYVWRVSRLKEANFTLEKKVEGRTKELVEKNIQIENEKKRSDNLLLNILPEEVAEELKEKGKTEARHYENVSVLFSDFVNFTQTSEQLTPQQLVGELNECFTAFDRIIERNGLEKIKTIGDAYMAVCGLPTPNPEHAERAVKAALEIRDFIEQRKLKENVFDIRIGINSGSVVAGIVGIKKFAYDIWGDTVNVAARMEQNCDPGKVNISESTYQLVKDEFDCTARGSIAAKGKGEVAMYFVENKN